jgi:hypothetical protein
MWSYTSTSQYNFIAWCLVKHRDKFTFTLGQESEAVIHYCLESGIKFWQGFIGNRCVTILKLISCGFSGHVVLILLLIQIIFVLKRWAIIGNEIIQ